MRKQVSKVAVTDYESVTLSAEEQAIHNELKQIWALEKETKARLVTMVQARHSVPEDCELEMSFRFGPAMRLIEKPQVVQSTKRTYADYVAAQQNNGRAY